VLRSSYPDHRREVVVVDNGSTDDTRRVAGRFPVRVLVEPRRGAVHARNRGVRETTGEILAFTDADCTVTSHWLTELVRPFASPSVAATSGELVSFPPQTGAERYMSRRKPRWQEWALKMPMPWLLIGNMAIRRTAFLQVGLLDPTFATVGCEDIDFSRRFFDAGLVHESCPRAIAFHKHRATARTLFLQQRRTGLGQSYICERYNGRGWPLAREWAAWRDLSSGMVRIVRSGDADREYLYYDLIRKLAQRIGFLEGRLRWRLARARHRQ
jgi:GT2 family glycosyltransferase